MVISVAHMVSRHLAPNRYGECTKCVEEMWGIEE